MRLLCKQLKKQLMVGYKQKKIVLMLKKKKSKKFKALERVGLNMYIVRGSLEYPRLLLLISEKRTKKT